jgi:hypothetical protein
MNANDMVLILLTGAGATAATDLWVILRRRMFGTPLPNFALVGRWIAHMTHGRFAHDSIAAAPAVHAERAVGWITHYATGMAFALLLPVFWGREWIERPTLLPALIVGIGTVAAPFFVMQPAMGLKPTSTARLHSFAMHAVFGIGLYLAGKIVSSLTTGE